MRAGGARISLRFIRATWLQWTAAGDGLRFCLLVHHTDAEREWAYGAESKVGTFSDALVAEAEQRGWTVVSMKNDWKRIFPFEKK